MNMKRALFCLIMCAPLAVASCVSDNEVDLREDPVETCDPATETLSGVIEPIIQANCAVPGCHITGRQAPNFTIKENIIAQAERIKTRTTAGTMPPSGPLSAEEVASITCWVDNGAQDN